MVTNTVRASTNHLTQFAILGKKKPTSSPPIVSIPPTPTPTPIPTPTTTPVPTPTPTPVPELTPTPVPNSEEEILALPSPSADIFNLSVVSGDNWLEIAWTTREKTTSQVRYGYAPSQYLFFSSEDPELVFHHVVRINNVDLTKPYFVQPISRTKDGREFVGGEIAWNAKSRVVSETAGLVTRISPSSLLAAVSAMIADLFVTKPILMTILLGIVSFIIIVVIIIRFWRRIKRRSSKKYKL
jgi:hypothetical protein